MDIYKNRPVFYSMGNFVFDQPGKLAPENVKKYLQFYGFSPESGAQSNPHPRHCRDTMLIHLEFSGKEFAVRITPVHIGEDATPRPVTRETTDGIRIFKLIRELNAEWGTVVEETASGFSLPLRREKADTRALIRRRKMSYPWLYRLRAAEERLV
jgi:hypothetical protein